MQPMIIYYYVNICVAFLLTSVTMSLIIYKSSSQMNQYKKYLINIQISAFLESFYWTVCFGPYAEPYPLIHIYCTGFLWTIFKVSTDIEWGFSTVFHGIICGALTLALIYRYFLLLPMSSIINKIPAVIMKHAQANINIGTYVFCTGVTSYLSAKGFLSTDETKQILLKADPTYKVPEGSMTFGGIYAIIWSGSLVGVVVFSFIAVSVIITHTNHILKSSGISQRSALMHKEAIRGLIFQMSLMWGGCAVPTLMLGIGMAIGIESLPPWFVQFAASFGVVWFSSKSINCCIAILLATTPYRRYLAYMLGLRKTATSVVAIRSQSSNNISNIN